MFYRRVVLTAGFAMFSMFFGSGNLVFPLVLGRDVTSLYPYATMGFIVTAVLVPFIGLIGMILYDGNTREYFSRLGRVPSFILVLLILSLMGPLGVVPRCITVAYGGLHILYPTLPYFVFSLIFCSIITILIWRSNRVIDVLGLFLTPFKLGGLMFLMLIGLYYAEPALPGSITEVQSLGKGLTLGYQTMDLMAAFFFSSATVQYLRSHLRPQDGRDQLIRISIVAALIGAIILGLSYVGFIALGAKYAPELSYVAPESLLVVISQKALGNIALPIVSFTMAIACLATSVILTLLFVEFFQKEVCRDKISEKQSILITVAATFGMSLLGFSKICELLGIILEVAYPALIALAITNIWNKAFDTAYGKIPFWFVLASSILWRVIQS